MEKLNTPIAKNWFAWLLIAGLITIMSACSDDSTALITATEVTNQDIAEKVATDLQFLREEEKLARDVYLFAFELYGIQLFRNIAESEQQHTTQVKAMMELYKIEDIASEYEGVFTNQELQTLYLALIERVKLNRIEAFAVGATIEDLDIYDLSRMAENTSAENIAQLYANLACGSANHMRSFYSQLQKNGLSYEPQYISSDKLAEILASQQSGCGY